jgi:hypothetical protein
MVRERERGRELKGWMWELGRIGKWVKVYI